jgi:hypothetical protein
MNPSPSGIAASTLPARRRAARPSPISCVPSAVITTPRNRIPGVCPASDQNSRRYAAPTANHAVVAEREAAAHEAGAIRRLGPPFPEQDRPHHALERVVEPARDPAHFPRDVLEQPGALRRDRLADLRRLGDSLDEPLRLVAREQPLPRLVDRFALERAFHGPVDDRAVEHSS